MIYISRQDVRRWYEANTTQTCIAVLLLGNFIISIYLAEDPHISPELAHQFDIIEMTFTLIYSVELAVNMAAHWCTPFFASAWNWFDLIIVGMSIYDAGYVLSGGSGSGLNVLRLMRILRVVRIFNKLENMRRILKVIVITSGHPRAPPTICFLQCRISRPTPPYNVCIVGANPFTHACMREHTHNIL